MQLKQYKDYAEYVASQKRTDEIKTPRPAVAKVEITAIAEQLRQSGILEVANREERVLKILCHGARGGQEVDWFAEEFPYASAWGTDLFLKGHPKIVQWDFHEPRRRWAGYFDVVYSNSLDHAFDPAKALWTWFNQLNSTGRLCIQWSQWHRTVRKGDCFGAEFHEYIRMLNTFGKVCSVVYHRKTIVTIIARRK